eukprot:1240288-Karenia_brevis.AAC.1
MRQEISEFKARHEHTPNSPTPYDPRSPTNAPHGVDDMDFEIFGDRKVPDEQSGLHSHNSPGVGENKVDTNSR